MNYRILESYLQELTLSDLSKKRSDQQKPNLDTTGQTSPKTVLTTMLLLIAGLLLSSVTMLHHSSTAKGTEEKPLLDVSTILEKAKTYTTQLKSSEADLANQMLEIAGPKQPGNIPWFGNKTSTVRWPKLELTGFGKAADHKGGFAILNGEQVLLGQLINRKVKLVQIRPHDVVVEYKGETKILTMDTQN